jgi:hypothetical protein
LIKKSQVLDNLPENLQVLKYPSNYNLILIDKIPQNIIRLFLSNKFNQSVDKLLNPNFGTSNPRPPTKITHLIFGQEFNQHVLYLPDTLTNIYFGNKFNKPVNNLPNSIQVISFGNYFNLSISNLPKNLIEITFGPEFNQIVNFTPSIKIIKFSKHICLEKYKINIIKYGNVEKYDGDEEYNYKYNYNKKIDKISTDTKIYLPIINMPKCCKTSIDEFYSVFSSHKDQIKYYK